MAQTTLAADRAVDGSAADVARPTRRTGLVPGSLGQALALWIATRVLVAVTITTTALVRDVEPGLRQASPGDWLVFRFAHWDSTLYGAVADRGYPPPGATCCYQAFFPGFPFLMRHLAPVVGGNLFVAGLVVAQLSGLVAVVLLWRLAVETTGRERAGGWAVLLLSLTPLSLYFTVVYTESLFLALTLGAWRCGRSGRWGWAGLLAGLACTIRINGLFVVAALAVMHVVQARGRRWRPPLGLLALGIGPLFVAWWMSWLHARTGLWNAWTVAQQQGWGRATAWPWAGVENALLNIRGADSTPLLVSRLLDVAATVVVVALPVVVVRRRQWPEAALVTLNAVTLVFTTMLVSNPRYLLTWFPVYLLVAVVAERHRRLAVAGFAASAVAMLVACVFWGAQWWVA